MMLLEIAIGDAYGAGFEYGPRMLSEPCNTLQQYLQHPRHRGTRPGMYTDGTQMSLAIAEALVDGSPWTAKALAGRFVTAFQRDPREGYASGFHAFLRSVHDGEEFLDRIRPISDKSGAAMRAAVITWWPSTSS